MTNQTVTGSTSEKLRSDPLTALNLSGAVTFSVSPTLPKGLALDTTTGIVSGVPSATASADYTITATGAAGGSATATLTLTIIAGENFTDVAVGTNHTVAVDKRGVLYAWGDNTLGQLGTGTTTPSSIPVPTRVDLRGVPEGVTFVQVAAGNGFSLALGSDGRVYSWGNGDVGQLGDGAWSSSQLPVVVSMSDLPLGVTFVKIAAGARNGYAIGSDKKLYAWGPGELGALGTGDSNLALTPVPVLLPSGFEPQQIRAGRTTRLRWTVRAGCSPGEAARRAARHGVHGEPIGPCSRDLPERSRQDRADRRGAARRAPRSRRMERPSPGVTTTPASWASRGRRW